MQVAFSHPGDEEHRVLATAVWDGAAVAIETDDEEIGDALRRAFRSTPVLTKDPSYRSLGTHGVVQVAPGTLEWFRAAATDRAPAETGLAARLIPGITEGGFDPAAGYRPFQQQLERLDAATRQGR